MKTHWIISLALLAAPLALLADTPAPAASPTVASAPASPTAKVGMKKVKPMKHKGGVNPLAMAAKASAQAGTKTAAAAVDGQKEHWTCPMDGGDFAHGGKCPKCGMDLVLKK